MPAPTPGTYAGTGELSEAESRNVMRVSLPTLPPGRYKVRWRVLAVDSHITEGAFTFRVAP